MLVLGAAVKVICGAGLTVIVYELGAPEQDVAGSGPLYGVTVIVAVIGVKPVFVAVKEEMFPDPDTGIPMATFVFVHVYDAVANPVEVKFDALTVAPSQIEMFAGTVTVAPGLEVTVTLEPTEQFALSTTTTVYVPAGIIVRIFVAVVFIVEPTNVPLELYQ